MICQTTYKNSLNLSNSKFEMHKYINVVKIKHYQENNAHAHFSI